MARDNRYSGFYKSQMKTKSAIVLVVVSMFWLHLAMVCESPPNLFFTNTTDAGADVLLLLYMGGDGKEESAMLSILNSLEASLGTSKFPTLALIDRTAAADNQADDWTDTRIYRLTYSGIDDQKLQSQRLSVPQINMQRSINSELNTGDASTLRGFLQYARERYVTKDTIVLLALLGEYDYWDSIALDNSHTVSNTDGTIKNDSLHLTEIKKALKEFGSLSYLMTEHMPMSVELWYELRDSVQYIVASPEVVLSDPPKWDYSALVNTIAAMPQAMSNKEKHQALQQALLTHYDSDTPLTLVSAQDATIAQSAVNDLGEILSAYIVDQSRQSEVQELIQISPNIKRSSSSGAYFFIDIGASVLAFAGLEGLDTAMKGLGEQLESLKSNIRTTNANLADLGVLVYQYDVSNSGAPSQVSSKYNRANKNDATLEFVLQSPKWSADSASKSGLLYRLWMDGELPDAGPPAGEPPDAEPPAGEPPDAEPPDGGAPVDVGGEP